MNTKWLKLSMVAAAIAALGLSSETTTDAGPGDKKVSLCHKGQTLEVPEAALQAHLKPWRHHGAVYCYAQQESLVLTAATDFKSPCGVAARAFSLQKEIRTNL
jgi:hypothetical protein